MPMGWCPRPASQTPSRPRNGPPEAGILFQCALSVLPQNVRETAVFAPVLAQMLTRPGTLQGRGEGSAPGFGVRVMGCARGRGRGENGYRITLWSAGALPGEILLRLPGACCIIPARIRETVRRFSVLLAQPGRVKLCDGKSWKRTGHSQP